MLNHSRLNPKTLHQNIALGVALTFSLAAGLFAQSAPANHACAYRSTDGSISRSGSFDRSEYSAPAVKSECDEGVRPK